MNKKLYKKKKKPYTQNVQTRNYITTNIYTRIYIFVYITHRLKFYI